MNLANGQAIQTTASSLQAHFSTTQKFRPTAIEHCESLAFEQRFKNSHIAAAVLIPIIRQPKGLEVLLTQRALHLRHHAGQISFPGGRKESYDVSAEATALRESYEEIGLVSDKVQILGQLGQYYTVSGFQITPVIGLIEQHFEPRLDSNEVSKTLQVPFDFLMDPANFMRREAVHDNVVRHYYAANYLNNSIWGVTAGIIVALYDELIRSHGQ